MEDVAIETATIRLDAVLKWAGVVQTGGQAKWLIQDGRVRVNGAVERRRSRKLQPGDRVVVEGLGSLRIVDHAPSPEADR